MFDREIFSHRSWLADRSEVSRRISGWRQQVEAEQWEWAKSRRLEYLTERKTGLIEAMMRGRIKARQLLLRAKTQDEADYLRALFASDPETPQIRKIDNEIKFKWNHPADAKEITQAQIERARGYPLWKWLGKRPNERIACPFHAGHDKNLGFKLNMGHCFVCGKSVNTIGWLMEINKMKFPQAVLTLQ